MFELESDPAFAFVDPLMARLILESERQRVPELFSQLLFQKGEEGDDADAPRVFDG